MVPYFPYLIMMTLDILHTVQTDSLNTVQAGLAEMVTTLANTPTDELLSDLIDKAIAFGLKVLAAVLIYLIGAWLIRKVKTILTRIFERKGTDAAIASFVKSLASLAMTIMLIIVTIGTLGIDTTSVAALLAGGGMAIGMALNGTVQNFAGGIMILVFRPFKAGDYIQAQGYEGTVSEINIVSTKLMTTDNKCIIIPNGILSNGTINNVSYNNIRRVDLTIDVEYGTDADKAKTILSSLIKDDKRVLTIADGAPSDPFVALAKLDSSSIQFIMRLWVDKAEYWNVFYELNEKIYKVLPENNIQFPYQKLDVNIIKNS